MWTTILKLIPISHVVWTGSNSLWWLRYIRKTKKPSHLSPFQTHSRVSKTLLSTSVSHVFCLIDELNNRVATTNQQTNKPMCECINDWNKDFMLTGRHVSSDKLCSSWTHTLTPSPSPSHTHPLFKSQRSCLRALYLLSRMALLIDEIPTQLQGHNIASPSLLVEKLASSFFPCFFPEGWYMTVLENASNTPTDWDSPHFKGPSPHKEVSSYRGSCSCLN